MAVVLDIQERGDGGAEITIDLSPREVELLLEDSILRALEKFLTKEGKGAVAEMD